MKFKFITFNILVILFFFQWNYIINYLLGFDVNKFNIDKKLD